jgi:hypothetical protein
MVRNCTRDEGGPFEVGNQVLMSFIVVIATKPSGLSNAANCQLGWSPEQPAKTPLDCGSGRSTGEQVPRGSITKAGNRRLC